MSIEASELSGNQLPLEEQVFTDGYWYPDGGESDKVGYFSPKNSVFPTIYQAFRGVAEIQHAQASIEIEKFESVSVNDLPDYTRVLFDVERIFTTFTGARPARKPKFAGIVSDCSAERLILECTGMRIADGAQDKTLYPGLTKLYKKVDPPVGGKHHYNYQRLAWYGVVVPGRKSKCVLSFPRLPLIKDRKLGCNYYGPFLHRPITVGYATWSIDKGQHYVERINTFKIFS